MIIEKTNDLLEFTKSFFMYVTLTNQLSLNNILFDKPEVGE